MQERSGAVRQRQTGVGEIAAFSKPGFNQGGLRFDVAVDRRTVVVHMALDVAAGECVALVGPSGAGKSTVLAAIAGLVPLRSGSVWLDGRILSSPERRPVPLRVRRVGLLTQRPGLFPHLDGAANIGYSLPGGAGHPRVRELADILELGDVLAVRPARMSAGQRQRVGLARVLAAEPRALLLDEPFSALDRELRDRTSAWVASEVRRRQVPCLMVTHDLPEAQRVAARVAVLAGGACLQVAAPDTVVRAPATPVVAQLVGYHAFVRVELTRPVSSAGPSPLPPGAATIGVHGDLVSLVPEASSEPVRGVELVGRLRSLTASGAAVEATVELDDGSDVPVRLPLGHPTPAIGTVLRLLVHNPPCFDDSGTLVHEAETAAEVVAAQPAPGAPSPHRRAPASNWATTR